MSRLRLLGIVVCLGLLGLMTWGQPMLASIVPPDSLLARVVTRLLLGLPMTCLGVWLVWRGFVSLLHAVTFRQETCTSCGGTGEGSHYVEVEHSGGPGRGTYVDRVLVNHCGSCGGTGSVYSATLVGAGVKVVSGVLLANIGGFMVGSMFERGPRPGGPDSVSPPVAEAAATAVPAGVSNFAKRSQTSSPDVTAPPASLPSPEELQLSGQERESNGTVWDLRGKLKRVGIGFRGLLTFQLRRVPPGAPNHSRVNASADMQVEATIVGNQLTIVGSRVSDPTLIGIGKYELIVDPDSKTFSGTLAGGAGTLTGTINAWPAR